MKESGLEKLRCLARSFVVFGLFSPVSGELALSWFLTWYLGFQNRMAMHRSSWVFGEVRNDDVSGRPMVDTLIVWRVWCKMERRAERMQKWYCNIRKVNFIGLDLKQRSIELLNM
jgi:hypothetical protein